VFLIGALFRSLSNIPSCVKNRKFVVSDTLKLWGNIDPTNLSVASA
jgi:hypothetical protein